MFGMLARLGNGGDRQARRWPLHLRTELSDDDGSTYS